ncbi:hypothetical protein Aperf_G00000023723 [Anoplocephala perfoliata]
MSSSFPEIIPAENVQWYYKPLKWDNTYFPTELFSGYDIIRIENQYREFRKELDKGKSRIDVREGLFEIDFVTHMCTPLYWNSDKFPNTPNTNQWRSAVVQRGYWFRTDNWEPLDETESDAVEEVFVNYIVKTVELPVSNKKNEGILLSRGYFNKVTVDSIPAEVSHVVLIAHGIGQIIGNITWDMIRMRETVTKVLEKYFPAQGRRIEIFPLEWRTTLPLDEGTIDSVTLPECQFVRAYLNSTALDIMYYTSSVQRMEIMKTFHQEVVRIYKLFCEHNPRFRESGGKISIVAHSLGAVIAFDVLTHSTPLHSDMIYFRQLQNMSNGNKDISNLMMQYIKLVNVERKMLNKANILSDEFELDGETSFPKIENLFCIGSPLAVFLALRGVHPRVSKPLCEPEPSPTPTSISKESIDSEIDENCENSPAMTRPQRKTKASKYRDESHLHNSKANFRLFNIFHPRDPVDASISSAELRAMWVINLFTTQAVETSILELGGLNAYRLEPLIFKHYANIQPALIGNPKLVKDPELPKSPPTRPIEDKFGFINENSNNKQKAKALKSNASAQKSVSLALNALENYLKVRTPGIETIMESYEKTFADMKLMPLPSERKLRARIDFQLEAEELTVQNMLVDVFTSHRAYWTNEALCVFLLSQILDEAPKFTTSQ